MRLLTLVVLVSCSLAHAQAMRPPPAAAPASGPTIIIQQPPTYPGATYTPTGTGLPAMGQPGTQRPVVERSPNKRVLPPMKEAGLWAADGAPHATGFVKRLYDVELPSPKEVGDEMAQASVSACLNWLGSAANALGLTNTILGFPEDARKCMAARALRVCADGGLKEYENLRQKALEYDADTMTRHRGVAEHARKLEEAYCADAHLTDEQDGLNRKVIAEWYRDLTGGRPSRR